MISFNGTTKIISISGIANSTVIDVERDIYSSWKVWVLEGDNIKYPQALRTIGGDSTGGVLTIPPYFFLMNNWKIQIDGITNLTFYTNLYCEETTNTNIDPFLVINNGSVVNKISDSPGMSKLEINKILRAVRTLY